MGLGRITVTVAANEVNKGVRDMTNERYIEGVENWNANTLRLEKELEATKEKLHFSRTLAERQKLLNLQDEVSLDREKVKELEARAYQVGIKNKPLIKNHLDEAERLRLESFDISADAWELQSRLRTKQTEMYQLQKAIADDKITG
jgi:hypothetical protein